MKTEFVARLSTHAIKHKGNPATEQLAEAVRAACVRTAVTAYEDAGLRGLCEAGRCSAYRDWSSLGESLGPLSSAAYQEIEAEEF